MKPYYKFLLSLLMMTLFSPLVMAAGTTKRPNIILVMADDQGWGQTGYNGHSLLKTPNLDAWRRPVFVWIGFMLLHLFVHRRGPQY
jgi:hypothetical protein